MGVCYEDVSPATAVLILKTVLDATKNAFASHSSELRCQLWALKCISERK
ncbi:hypothetical protein [Sicyoidochytrium minutum DNA virus]|nr:hypothetical protein [Sicyoidochytrium minutum DNA virus]